MHLIQLIFSLFFLGFAYTPEEIIHKDLHVDTLDLISFEHYFNCHELTVPSILKELAKTIQEEASNKEYQIDIFDANYTQGIILAKNISQELDPTEMSIKNNLELQSVNINWDLKVIQSTNNKLKLVQDNMFIKYIAFNEQGIKITQIQKIEDDISTLETIIGNKEEYYKKQLVKDQKRLKRGITRNEKKLSKEKNEDRIARLEKSLKNKRDELKILNDPNYIQNKISSDIKNMVDNNLHLYVKIWEEIKEKTDSMVSDHNQENIFIQN